MDTVIEQQRSAHEEIERLEQAIISQYLLPKKTHKEKLTFEHRVNDYLDRIANTSAKLCDLYTDRDGTRAKQIQALSAPNEFSEFYERLKSIKDHHRRYPNQHFEPMEVEFLREAEKGTEDDDLDRLFSGEESNGRFLDLNNIFEAYINLKGVSKMGYLAFLSRFDDFADIYPKHIKKSAEYKSYLTLLYQYLESFFSRAKPLYNLPDLRERTRKQFDQQWSEGKVPGWEKKLGEDDVDMNGEAMFCLACEKQFSNQAVFENHLKGKKHVKAQAALASKQGADVGSVVEKREKARMEKEEKEKQVAWFETLISKYAEVLGQEREDTKANVERKQALTDRERALEQEQQENIEDTNELGSDSDDDDDKIYNPLKLPLGWDGKPIPYWLYKLHGLGVEYPCEICGNYVYMGRKAFDKHFQEWRHAQGMRALAIPNTRQFHEITLIEDAYALWEKIKATTKSEETKADQIEEYEDERGNVFSKKTYDDLKRQGIL
ncbi:hypothetical protein BZG36_00173 [Bifiguratus adelaidae]|uniref:Matrin-type domain-containing protein n=1 Tax=Bifiguratus adelaidae TaxID=1938954 RepID=A0A261Y8M6_9FUNG|nr:hypothetical protein BZG36_00173 [Bifiguratus adelaidae]